MSSSSAAYNLKSVLVSGVLMVSLFLMSVPSSVQGRFFEDLGTTEQYSEFQALMTQAALPNSPSRFTQIAVGRNHSCAVTAGGGVKCWGANAGALGNATRGASSTPVDVVGLTSGVLKVAAGDSHTCALEVSGRVKCWGANYNGQLGDGTSMQRLVPVEVVGLTNAVPLGTGANHTCAVISNGAAKCWGYNAYGQIGDGETASRYLPVDVLGLSSGVASITTGTDHTCASLSSGALKCWGYNWQGQLGDGTRVNRMTPVDVVGLSTGVVAAAAGSMHSCARISTGIIKCWGGNSAGQLGNGTGSSHLTPQNVVGISDAAALTAGGSHTCAIRQGGQALCWGSNGAGALGDGTTINRWTPTNVQDIESVSVIAAGMSHTCAVTADQAVKCWGYNMSGQLGNGVKLTSSTPLDVIGFTERIVELATGEHHACALKQSGSVSCWGDNGRGALGDGTMSTRTSPVSVTGLNAGIRAIVAGRSHTCALSVGGAVKCWGSNYFGQLGDGTNSTRTTPVDVVDLSSGVTQLVAGMDHNCAVTSTGIIKCWGSNSMGQLGDGTTQNRLTPVNVTGLPSGISTVDAGSLHSCAAMSNGAIKCWGDNRFGQLGDGTLLQRLVPVDVVGLSSGATAVTTGGLHSCALLSNHDAQCWGANFIGQIGDGTVQQRPNPTNVTGLASNTAAIVAGSSHTCAVTLGAATKCWGDNSGGQLGDGSVEQRNSPVSVIGLSGGTDAIYPNTGTCALTTSGQPKCWGSDLEGQLGQGRITRQLLPVAVLETPTPTISINHTAGSPGSYFTITGWNFPPNSDALLSINGQTLASDLVVSPTGTFVIFLNTDGTDEGSYTATVSVNPSASIGFMLSTEQPMRPQDGGGQVINVPPGIAYTDHFFYLPAVYRD